MQTMTVQIYHRTGEPTESVDLFSIVKKHVDCLLGTFTYIYADGDIVMVAGDFTNNHDTLFYGIKKSIRDLGDGVAVDIGFSALIPTKIWTEGLNQ